MDLPLLEAVPFTGDFHLGLTLNCGQVFHWEKLGHGYIGAVVDLPIYLEQRGGVLWASQGSAAALRHYLALDHPLADIYASLPRDPAMAAALATCLGLRIVRQPLWECLATFITSSLKQVAHIAQISHALRRRFGRQVGEIAGRPVYAYPPVETIASLGESELRACGLGFRATSLLAAARWLVAAGGGQGGERQLEEWRALDRAAGLQALRSLRGVGTKVANCVLLFGYEHLDAFPIDVWIERVLRERYFAADPDAKLAHLQEFAQKHFGPFGGYAQQYLFHHARAAGRKAPPADGAVKSKRVLRPVKKQPYRRGPARAAASAASSRVRN